MRESDEINDRLRKRVTAHPKIVMRDGQVQKR